MRVETGQDSSPFTPSPGPLSRAQSHWPALLEGGCESALRSSECKVQWAVPPGRGAGPGRCGREAGLCLGKLVCVMLQAVAARKGGACGRCFLAHLPHPSPRRLLPVGGGAGAAAGAPSLLLRGRPVAGSKGTCAWGLRTISLRHLWSLAEAEFGPGPVLQQRKHAVLSLGDFQRPAFLPP